MTIHEMILSTQAALGLEEDGIAGPKTWGTIYRTIVLGKKVSEEDAGHNALSDISVVDERSEKMITTLLPEVRPYARALVHAARQDLGVTLIVTSGTRTYEEQAELRRKYLAGKGGKAAAPGYSNHNFGIAFDVTIFNGKTPVWESPKYKAVGTIGLALGLVWGGTWTGRDNDEPHFSLRPAWGRGMKEGEFVAELRKRRKAGKAVFA